MTKEFTRIEPTITHEFGDTYKRQAVVKTFRTEDGLKHEFTTLYAEGSQAAGVIALTADNQVLTVFQFRPGSEQWVYDIPGGSLNHGEDPEAGALRELKEETGYMAGKVEFLGKSYGDGYSNLLHYYYFATDCVPEGSGSVFDDEEHDQGAQARLLTITDFLEKSKHSSMTDPHAVLMAYDKLIARVV